MQQPYTHEQFTDDNGNPAGGHAFATGCHIDWQNGPLGAPDDPSRQDPNGAFVETVIRIATDRISFYQDSAFACIENAVALGHLEAALRALENRTKRRTRDLTEGTHRGN